VNPYRRAALFFLRLAGTGCLVIGLLLLGGEVAGSLTQRPVKSPWFVVVLEAGLALAGVLLLTRARSIAARWTKQFDEPEEKSLEELLDSDDER
jgi:hypothetical protein